MSKAIWNEEKKRDKNEQFNSLPKIPMKESDSPLKRKGKKKLNSIIYSWKEIAKLACISECLNSQVKAMAGLTTMQVGI